MFSFYRDIYFVNYVLRVLPRGGGGGRSSCVPIGTSRVGVATNAILYTRSSWVCMYLFGSRGFFFILNQFQLRHRVRLWIMGRTSKVCLARRRSKGSICVWIPQLHICFMSATQTHTPNIFVPMINPTPNIIIKSQQLLNTTEYIKTSMFTSNPE